MYLSGKISVYSVKAPGSLIPWNLVPNSVWYKSQQRRTEAHRKQKAPWEIR
jgi:hypothetical protein